MLYFILNAYLHIYANNNNNISIDIYTLIFLTLVIDVGIWIFVRCKWFMTKPIVIFFLNKP